jgi:hypothetical protein
MKVPCNFNFDVFILFLERRLSVFEYDAAFKRITVCHNSIVFSEVSRIRGSAQVLLENFLYWVRIGLCSISPDIQIREEGGFYFFYIPSEVEDPKELCLCSFPKGDIEIDMKNLVIISRKSRVIRRDPNVDRRVQQNQATDGIIRRDPNIDH